MSSATRAKLLSGLRKKRKERPNTPKQKVFVEEVKRTGDLVGSALTAYDTDNPRNVGKIIKHNMSKASIREEVEGCYKEAGLETINVMKALGEALRATKPDVVTDKSFIEGGPDHRIRLDAAKEALKLKDAYPKEDPTKHIHAHLHMIEELSKLPFEELTSMMKTEVILEGSEEQDSVKQ